MTNITLDRRELLAPLFPDQADWLFVSGLAGSSKDAAGLTQDGANLFTMAGCMGSAVATGLGMALSAPDRNVAVITGDGELQMGETGGQEGHTVHRTNLGMIAQGAGFPSVKEITSADQIANAHDFIRTATGPRFLWCRVLPGDPTAFKRNFDPAYCRIRFRDAYLGA